MRGRLQLPLAAAHDRQEGSDLFVAALFDLARRDRHAPEMGRVRRAGLRVDQQAFKPGCVGSWMNLSGTTT